MDYLNNVFGLMLGLGILALIVVVLLYFYQKKKVRHSANPTVVESDTEVIDTAEQLVELKPDSLRDYLSPLRNDQPILMHKISNYLERAKSRSTVKVLREVLAQLEVKSELLAKIDEYEENLHTLNRKKDNFNQRDEMQDLTHEREKKRILNEIEHLADEAGGIEKARKRELDSLEAELTHQNAMKSVRNKLNDIADRNVNSRKNKQLNDMNDVFNIQYKAIEENQKLSSIVKKETLRTLERTFIAQLDEFTKGL